MLTRREAKCLTCPSPAVIADRGQRSVYLSLVPASLPLLNSLIQRPRLLNKSMPNKPLNDPRGKTAVEAVQPFSEDTNLLQAVPRANLGQSVPRRMIRVANQNGGKACSQRIDVKAAVTAKHQLMTLEPQLLRPRTQRSALGAKPRQDIQSPVLHPSGLHDSRIPAMKSLHQQFGNIRHNLSRSRGVVVTV